jgi:hypothetical protein
MADVIVNANLPVVDDAWDIGSIYPNPKNRKSDAYKAYAVMTEGMTIPEYKLALGTIKKWRAEIAWNFARGYITLVDPAGKVYGELRGPKVEAEAVDAE